MTYIKLGATIFAFLAVTSFVWASESDELREKAKAMQREAATLPSGKLFAADEAACLHVGLVTDLHYADKPPAGSRHYRETLDKLAEAAEQFGKHKPAFLVELGDFIDAADSVDAELGFPEADQSRLFVHLQTAALRAGQPLCSHAHQAGVPRRR